MYPLKDNDIGHYESARQIMEEADWSPDIFSSENDLAKAMNISSESAENVMSRLDLDRLRHDHENIIMLFINTHLSDQRQ